MLVPAAPARAGERLEGEEEDEPYVDVREGEEEEEEEEEEDVTFVVVVERRPPPPTPAVGLKTGGRAEDGELEGREDETPIGANRAALASMGTVANGERRRRREALLL